MRGLLLTFLAACPSAQPGAPAPTPESDQVVPAPDLALESVRALPDGPVAFLPSSGALAVGAGVQVKIYAPEGAEVERWNLPWTAQDLRFATDEIAWVLGPGELLRVEGGVERCRLELEGEASLLGLTPEGGARLGERRWTEEGVWGQDLVVGPDCSASRGPLIQRPATAAAGTWLARAGVVGGGPSRVEPPRVEPSGEEQGAFFVFADADDVNVVLGLHVEEGRLLALGTGGRWELWDLQRPSKIAEGRDERTTSLVPLGEGEVALGRGVMGMATGALTEDALPAPALAVSGDGARLVLGEEGERRLWRRAAPY